MRSAVLILLVVLAIVILAAELTMLPHVKLRGGTPGLEHEPAAHDNMIQAKFQTLEHALDALQSTVRNQTLGGESAVRSVADMMNVSMKLIEKKLSQLELDTANVIALMNTSATQQSEENSRLREDLQKMLDEWRHTTAAPAPASPLLQRMQSESALMPAVMRFSANAAAGGGGGAWTDGTSSPWILQNRLPAHLMELIAQEDRDAPDAIMLHEVNQVLEPLKGKPSLSLLDASRDGGRLRWRFGSLFSSTVIVVPPEEVVELRALHMVSPPNVEIMEDSIESYVNKFSADGGGRRFDVIFLASILERMVTDKVRHFLQSLSHALSDDGVVIVVSTHIEEGKSFFQIQEGMVVPEEDFNTRLSRGSPPSGARRWYTSSELQSELEDAEWSVTSHVVYSYLSLRSSQQLFDWQQSRLGRSFRDILHQPVSQMLAVTKQLSRPSSNESSSSSSNKALAQLRRLRRRPAGNASLEAAPVQPTSPDKKSVIFTLVRGGSFRKDFDDFVLSRRCLRDLILQPRNENQQQGHQTGTGANMSIGSSNGTSDKGSGSNGSKPGGIVTVPWDDVIFHEGDLAESLQHTLAQELPGIRFVDSRLYGGFGGINSSEARWKPWKRLRRPGEYPWGYKHMCRFMSMQWFVALRLYDFAMRVDDDVCIHRLGVPHPNSSSSNLMKALSKKKEAIYGYGLEYKERHDETIKTLQPWLELYILGRGLQIDAHSGHMRRQCIAQADVQRRMYFTNVFLGNVSWWFKPDVQNFLDAVDRSGGIFDYRWGDAPLQTLALCLFADATEVTRIDMDYTHLSTTNEIRSGEEVAFTTTSTTRAAVAEFGWVGGNSQMVAILSELASRQIPETYEASIAPCIVANHFHLPGGPFTTPEAAIRALKIEVVMKTMASGSNMSVEHLGDYSPWELARIVQLDLRGSLSGPAPRDAMRPCERLDRMYFSVTGVHRTDPEQPVWSQEEADALFAHPCLSADSRASNVKKAIDKNVGKKIGGLAGSALGGTPTGNFIKNLAGLDFTYKPPPKAISRK